MTQQEDFNDIAQSHRSARHRHYIRLLLMVAVLVIGVAACALGKTELDRTRAECEARDGHTELRSAGGVLYICYDVTVDDVGWRQCNASEPWLQVSVEQSQSPQTFPYGCGNTPESSVVVDAARAECEGRAGNTELLAYGPGYLDCYTVTVQSDGWRTCVYNRPSLRVRAVAPYDPDYYPCGVPGPEWPYMIEAGPEDCEAAQDWYTTDYGNAIIDNLRDVRNAVAQFDTDAARLAPLGYLFEQNERRADATKDACRGQRGIETVALYIGIADVREEFDVIYGDIVRGCTTAGIHDCTALAPTPKTDCERNPDRVYSLNESALVDWPFTRWRGCGFR